MGKVRIIQGKQKINYPTPTVWDFPTPTIYDWNVFLLGSPKFGRSHLSSTACE
ncbi:hypothetical protein NIES2098_48330 [Calothrix sp. NIES-2098]|nr:hypothetical protein NIES2098_48330 [Calothrix sp. NIES-2098]